jgi:chromosome segregation ATPase
MGSNGTAHVNEVSPSADYQDTIALLQEEIVRLEEEIRIRDEERLEEPPALESEVPLPPGPDPAEAKRIEELTADLARRDETIVLLLDEIQLIEEAEAAKRAEWEQLNQWVEQVEERVESRDRDESNHERELESERRKSAEQRQSHETDKRAWQTQRKTLEEEIERMRARLSSVAKQTDSNADLALAALEGENRRLRKTCDELARKAAAADELGKQREQFVATRNQLDEAQAKVRSLEDDIQRERKEHEAALASLRSKQAQEPLQRREAHAETPSPAPRDLSLVTAEERMSAFRQHLQELHQREIDDRANNRLSARLSRLWRRTGPAH